MKKKLAAQNGLQVSDNEGKSRARSEQAYGSKLGESNAKSDQNSLSGLDNVNVVDPSSGQIDRKKLQQLRAK